MDIPVAVEFPFGRLDQATRLLRLDLPGAPGAVPLEVQGREQLHGCFRLEIDLLDPEPDRSLKALLGQPLGLSLALPDGSLRYRAGLVTGARHLACLGGHARRRLLVEPLLALLGRARGSRLWVGRSAPEIASELLAAWRQRLPALGKAFRLEAPLRRNHPVLELKVMYRESPRAFLERLLAQAGIGWTWRFEAGEVPRHVLVLFDEADELPSAGALPWQPTPGAETRDSLQRLEAQRELRPGQVNLATWNEGWGGLEQAAATTALDLGPAAALAEGLEWFDAPGLRHGEDAPGLAERGEAHQAWEDARSLAWHGEGCLRDLGAGDRFDVTGHPSLEEPTGEAPAFVVTELCFRALNNFRPAQGSPDPPFTARFQARSTSLPPPPRAAPRSPGPQVAQVVGPARETVHTDAFGRVRLRFPWMRAAEHPEAGPEGPCTCWVRVARPLAGPGLGWQTLPRVGDEVLVDFIEGDLDRPVVVGALHHGGHPAPALGGWGHLPADRALSGLRTREHGGPLGSELAFDDTPGQVQARLATEAHRSALHLGALTGPRQGGRATPRGAGAELATEGAIALRAARGLLLSARAQAEDAQLARRELQACLQEGRVLLEALAEQAAALGATTGALRGTAPLLERLAQWDPGGEVPAGLLALDAPAGWAAASGADATLHAAGDLSLGAEGQGTLLAGGPLHLLAGGSLALSAQDGPLQATAQRGALELAALQGPASLASQGQLRLMSHEGELLLVADTAITLLAEGAYLKLGAGAVEVGCTGSFTAKAARHDWEGPAQPDRALGTRTPGPTRRRFRHVFQGTGAPIPRAPYRLELPDGQVIEGLTDADGLTADVEQPAMARLQATFQPPG